MVLRPAPAKTEVKSSASKEILLHDVTKINGKEYFLFATDYLSDCDMVVEERSLEGLTSS